jgi:hypothetical protein
MLNEKLSIEELEKLQDARDDEAIGNSIGELLEKCCDEDSLAKENSPFIRKLLEKLAKQPWIEINLRLIAKNASLRIKFDFKNSVIKGSNGWFEPRNSAHLIYICAEYLLSKDEVKEDEVCGVFAHESTHCAMLMTYGNLCKPFAGWDALKTSEFAGVLVECLENRDKHVLIGIVFAAYKYEQWYAELIVRVNHFIAMNIRNNLRFESSDFTRYFPKLTNYYKNHVINDVMAKLQGIYGIKSI